MSPNIPTYTALENVKKLAKEVVPFGIYIFCAVYVVDSMHTIRELASLCALVGIAMYYAFRYGRDAFKKKQELVK